jgi:hypothetical protein
MRAIQLTTALADRATQPFHVALLLHARDPPPE